MIQTDYKFRVTDIIQIVVIIIGFLYAAGARGYKTENLDNQQRDLTAEVNALKREVVDLRLEMVELKSVMKTIREGFILTPRAVTQ